MQTETLRCGWTTGSAMTAAALAAWRGAGGSVRLQLPGGETPEIPIARIWPGGAAVIKDGGDDPDVTSGCEISVTVVPFSGEPEEADHLIPCGKGEIVIRGGTGVGHVTRPGLAVPVGKAAVNPGPRRILAENFKLAGFGRTQGERLLVTVSVPEGEEIAKKTLNPVLGIAGGISILGNSGIVRPFSNAAYAATIALQLRSAAANGATAAALTTGNRTTAAVRRDWPGIPPEAVVPVADFIEVALKAVVKAGFERVIVGCMPGKLFKYACGFENTHAHRNKLTLARLRDFGVDLPGIPLEAIDTMGELRARIGESHFQEVLDPVYIRAREVLREWVRPVNLELALYDEDGRRIR